MWLLTNLSLNGQIGEPKYNTKGFSVGDVPLFLKDGENAYLAKPDDVEAFANKLNECLSDPIKASFIGKKGEELVYREFNYLEVTKNIVYSM